MANENLVEPVTAAPVAPVETAETPAPDIGEAANLPEEVLKIPSVMAVFAGQPPAVSSPIAEAAKRPETKLLAKNKEPLMQAGIGFYRSLGGDLGVMFNQLYLHGDELLEADKAGRLLEIAPPADAVTESLLKSGDKHPSLTSKGPPAAPAGAPMPSAQPGVAAPSQLPAAPAPTANQKMMMQRVQNIKPGGPTSGARPGGGRLLNSILKPVL